VTVAERLEQLRLQYNLTLDQRERLGLLLDVLAGDPHSPSAVTDRARAVDVHMADSLSALTLDLVRDADVIADIGAGAGFPGLALAIALPKTNVALVESTTRKCEFLERARAAVEAENVEVVAGRVELWQGGYGRHDLVTARALGSLALLCEYAAPLLRIGGTLVAWKGTVTNAERRAGDAASIAVGLESAGVIRTEPYAGCAAHHLYMYAKVSNTPSRFPRRPGMARKHPLDHRNEC
jgi:16S rRNA (guanine527-N7)-methyltransferase